MKPLDDYSVVFVSALATAWGKVLGPLLAVTVGAVVAGATAGYSELGYFGAIFALLAMPFISFTQWGGAVLFLAIVASLIWFWMASRYRIDALILVAALTAVQTHRIMGTKDPTWLAVGLLPLLLFLAAIWAIRIRTVSRLK